MWLRPRAYLAIVLVESTFSSDLFYKKLTARTLIVVYVYLTQYKCSTTLMGVNLDKEQIIDATE